MAKDDYNTHVNTEKINQEYHQKSSFVKESEHLKSRIIVAVEATYDVLGWHKHGNSRNVKFINTDLYGHDSSLRIRQDLDELPEDSEDVFAKGPVQVYEKRDGAKKATVPQFFCRHIRNYLKGDEEELVAIREAANRMFY